MICYREIAAGVAICKRPSSQKVTGSADQSVGGQNDHAGNRKCGVDADQQAGSIPMTKSGKRNSKPDKKGNRQ